MPSKPSVFLNPGDKFGKLTVVRPARRIRWHGYIYRRYLVRCQCGKEFAVTISGLREGAFTSCGRGPCRAGVKHGLFTGVNGIRYHRTAVTYFAMHDRCERRTGESWENYGGRGIKVCERWSGPDGLVNFIADMGRRPRGKTLDRIEKNGNYEPGNCRWATAKVQANNRRNNLPTTAEVWGGQASPLDAPGAEAF